MWLVSERVCYHPVIRGIARRLGAVGISVQKRVWWVFNETASEPLAVGVWRETSHKLQV